MGEAALDVSLLVYSRSSRKHAVRLYFFFILFSLYIIHLQSKGQGKPPFFSLSARSGRIFWLFKATFSWNNPENPADLQKKPLLAPPKALLSLHPTPPPPAAPPDPEAPGEATQSSKHCASRLDCGSTAGKSSRWAVSLIELCWTLCDVSRGQTVGEVGKIKGGNLLPPFCCPPSVRGV